MSIASARRGGVHPRPTTLRFTSHNEADTERIAARIAKTLCGGDVLLLEGELGIGKTAFVRGLARSFGVRGRVTSPTFVLLRAYAIRTTLDARRMQGARYERRALRVTRPAFLVHADAYRVHDARELLHAGLSEWIGRPDAIVVIEWGERCASLLRGVRMVRLRFAHGRTPDARRITMTAPRLLRTQ